MEPDIYRTLPQPCPACGAPNDGHLLMAGQGGPEPGTVSVCGECVTIGIFAEEGGIRLPTPQEAAELVIDADVQRAVRMVKYVQVRRHPEKN
jgi:hypothetical protein